MPRSASAGIIKSSSTLRVRLCNSVRKLSDEELSNIKVLSQGAALRFLLTRVFDALNKVEGAIVKIKDPMEYLKRLEFHKSAKNYEDYFF